MKTHGSSLYIPDSSFSLLSNHVLLKHAVFYVKVAPPKLFSTTLILCALKICDFDSSGLGRRLKMYDE